LKGGWLQKNQKKTRKKEHIPQLPSFKERKGPRGERNLEKVKEEGKPGGTTNWGEGAWFSTGNLQAAGEIRGV